MATSGEHHELDHHHHPIRRSSARRKGRGSASGGKKNKQPGRGMGVAKLERLRLLEETTTTTTTNFAADLPQPIGFPGFYASDHRLLLGARNGGGTGDREIANCYSLHCNACHKKKKKVNVIGGTVTKPETYECGDHLRFLGLDLGEPPQPKASLGNFGNKVEVVAVHRKGSCNSWDVGKGHVVMEYDFFPAKSGGGGGGGGEEREEMGTMKVAVGPSMAATKSVDLSLKLSY